MEKFLALPVEKRKVITNAALKCFGTNGYKKASVSDIATAAGISKAMVFHYFGSKRALYFYLVELCGDTIMAEINEKFDPNATDMFDRIRLATSLKISVIEKHPEMLSFLNSVAVETDNEVKADLETLLAKGEDFRAKVALDGIDTAKFKDGLDIDTVKKMLNYFIEGFVSKLPGQSFEAVCKDFDACLDLLRRSFYKEQYL